MIIPDPPTLIVIMAGLGVSLFLSYRIIVKYKTIFKIKERISNGGDGQYEFIVDHTKKKNLFIVAEQLFFLLFCIGLYFVTGSPKTDTDYFSPNVWFFTATFLQLCLFVFPPMITTLNDSSEFFLVSRNKIERHKGSKVITTIRWEDITYIGTNLGQQIDCGDVLRIIINGCEKKLSINTSMNNIPYFYLFATELVPEKLRTSKTYGWIKEQVAHDNGIVRLRR